MTLTLTQKAKNEALSIAGGLYRMNATSAIGYCFSVQNNEIAGGEFMFRTETLTKYHHEYFYSFITNKFYKLVESDTGMQNDIIKTENITLEEL